MNVGSQLEIYTTMFGWAIYERFWELLTATGLAAAPFMVMAWRNWVKPYLSSDNRPAAGVSMKQMELGVYGAILVVMLAAIPAVPIHPTDLRYTPPTAPDGREVRGGATGTTYDDMPMSSEHTQAKLPIIWWFVLTASGGMNAATREMLSEVPDIRAMRYQLAQSKIGDPDLIAETSIFVDSCFMPARARYKNKYLGGELPQSIRSLLDEYGKDDTEWMGSHVFLETEGLYKKCSTPARCGTGFQANRAIRGWPYESSRDFNRPSEAENPPEWGRPWCREWWLDAERGLKNRIIAEGPGPNVSERIHRTLGTGEPEEILNDKLAQRVLQNTTSTLAVPDDYAMGHTAMDTETGRSWMGTIKDAFGWMGAAVEGGLWSVKMNIYLQVMVMVQAVLLMALYMLLPWGLVFGQYSSQIVWIGVLAIFSVRYWTSLWAIAWWVDQSLADAMFPRAEALIGAREEFGTQRMLLDMVTGALYFGLPVLWVVLVGWAGHAIGEISGASSNIGGAAHGAGNAAGGTAASAASAGKRAAGGALKK